MTEQDEEQDNSQKKFWKRKGKKGFDFHQRFSRKIDENEAEQFKRRDKKQPFSQQKLKQDNLASGMLKLRKKIRDVYDEDDEDEEEDFIFVRQQSVTVEDEPDNRLYNALTAEEKQMIHQQDIINQMKMQQTAGKMEALQLADKLAQETMQRGLKHQDIDNIMQSAVFNPKEEQERLIKKEINGKLGMRGTIEDGKIIQAARGIKKVQMMGGDKATKNLEMKDVVRAGEGKMNDKELAELILEKSGQDIKKYKPKMSDKKQTTELKHLKPTVKKKEIEY